MKNWINQNKIPLLLLLGYYIYDYLWIFFKNIHIDMINPKWELYHYIYKLGEQLFSPSLLLLFIIYAYTPKKTDAEIILIGLILVSFKDFLGKLLEILGINIDFFNNYTLKGSLYETALPIFLIATCFLGRFIGRKWKSYYG